LAFQFTSKSTCSTSLRLTKSSTGSNSSIPAEGHPRFVVDRNRVTGGGVSSGLDEALKLVELLSSYEVAQQVQQNIQYYPCPPVASSIPATSQCPLDS